MIKTDGHKRDKTTKSSHWQWRELDQNHVTLLSKQKRENNKRKRERSVLGRSLHAASHISLNLVQSASRIFSLKFARLLFLHFRLYRSD